MARMTSEKKCTSCGILKGLDNFYYRKERQKHVSKCRDCISSAYVARYISDPEARDRKLEYNNKYYSINSKRIHQNRKEKINTDLKSRISLIYRAAKQRSNKYSGGWDITVDYLIYLYNQQKGKCALSGEILELKGDRYLSNMLSLDRIDSNIGYLKDNVQWVGVKYNMMKAHANQKDFLEMCNNVIRTLSCE